MESDLVALPPLPPLPPLKIEVWKNAWSARGVRCQKLYVPTKRAQDRVNHGILAIEYTNILMPSKHFDKIFRISIANAIYNNVALL